MKRSSSGPSSKQPTTANTSSHTITAPCKSFKHPTFNWLSAGTEQIDQSARALPPVTRQEIADTESRSAASIGYGQGHPQTTYYLNHPRTRKREPNTEQVVLSNTQLRNILAGSLGYGSRHRNYAAYTQRPEFDRDQVMGVSRSVPVPDYNLTSTSNDDRGKRENIAQ
jgi:hypothetical protein